MIEREKEGLGMRAGGFRFHNIALGVLQGDAQGSQDQGRVPTTESYQIVTIHQTSRRNQIVPTWLRFRFLKSL